MAIEDLSPEPEVAFDEASENDFSTSALPAPIEDEIKDPDAGIFDVKLNLSEDDEKYIIAYLEDNLPKMKPPETEVERIRSYLGMYEMAIRDRSFPYEGAPSLASSDAYDTINKWLDVAEVAFLQNRVTFTIDREEVNFSEDKISRIEKTYHRKFFLKNLAPDLRLILFEASYLGASVVSTRETYDVRPIREKVVIKTEKDLDKYSSSLSKAQADDAKRKISEGDLYLAEIDSIKIICIGPIIGRIDQTKFWYPRNTKLKKEWKIVAEQEFYTRSAMKEMAERGEFIKSAVDECLSTRDSLYHHLKQDEEMDEKDRNKLPEYIRFNDELDETYRDDAYGIERHGDAYQDEFAVYRVTMLYGLTSKINKNGILKTWIEVMYCPAGNKILSATVCQDGFPYEIIQYRPVPYRAMGSGIAQERYHHNILDSDLKSLFLAGIEQEMGAPLLIRKNSSLYASGFRAYPSSVAYVDDIDRDVKFQPFPEKTRLAAAAMNMVIGSSPTSNKGAGYNSGRREELMQNAELSQQKARIHSIAMDLDRAFNQAWKIHCRLSRFNKHDRKIVDWVYKTDPANEKLYVLEDEMDPNIPWSSILSAVSLTPDARLMEAMRKYEFFYKQVPSLQSNPEKTINWLLYMADFFGIDEKSRAKLLPNINDFQQYQMQLGEMGKDNQKAETTPEAAQSSSTPFSRPANTQQS